jgi:hypothetical protein
MVLCMQRVPLLGVQACPHRRHRRVTVERIWILDLKFGSMNLDFADASDFAGAEKVKSLHDFSLNIFFSNLQTSNHFQNNH